MPAWFSVGDVPLNPKSKDFVEDYRDSVERIHKDIESLGTSPWLKSPIMPNTCTRTKTVLLSLTSTHARPWMIHTQTLVEKGIPTEHIFIGGFSQGGALAIASVFRSERKLAGAICLSGWVVEPSVSEPPLRRALNLTLHSLELLRSSSALGRT